MANLSRGSSGNDVKELQQFLIDHGYDVGSTGADGKFGANTEAAVKKYQEDQHIKSDGIVGSVTRGTIDSYDDSSSSSSSSSSPSSNVTAGTGLSSGSSGTSGNVYNYYTNNTVERDPFQTSAETNDWKYQLDDLIDNPVGDYVESGSVTDLRTKLDNILENEPADYVESEEVKAAKAAVKKAEDADPGSYAEGEAVKKAREALTKIETSKPSAYTEGESVKKANAALSNIESNKPSEYKSEYKDRIDTILDGILNKKSFDVKNDSNYTYLYDLAKQSAMQNADKAMRDTMGAAQGQTGGYGSTYSQMVGQQAADQSLQSLNDNNVSLMSLARSMYDSDVSNEYNKLNALNNQESVDYGRYRDTVGDWQTDRSYYANRADAAYNKDYGQYRDTVGDWQTDRAYYANRYDTESANDYNKWQGSVSKNQADRSYYANRADSISADDYNKWRDTVTDWKDDRAYYDNAWNNERVFDYGQYQDEVAQYNNDRSFIGGMYEDSKANDLTQYQYDNNYDLNASDTLYDRAMNFAKNGISVPSNYSGSLTEEEIAAINQVAAEANAEKAAAASGGSNPGNGKQTPVKADGTKWTASDSTDDDPEAGVRQIVADKYAADMKTTNSRKSINGEEMILVGGKWITMTALEAGVANGSIKEESKGNNTYSYSYKSNK